MKIFDNNIIFLNTATFNGNSYITFASHLDIMWEDYLKATIDKNILARVYPENNIRYYNQVLYQGF